MVRDFLALGYESPEAPSREGPELLADVPGKLGGLGLTKLFGVVNSLSAVFPL